MFFGWHAATFLCRPSLLNPSMSSDLGARAQWRRHESARDRRARRQRAECRLRLRLVRDAACVAAHRGGSPVSDRPVDGGREAFDRLRDDIVRLQEDLLVLRSEVSDVNHNAVALTKGVTTLARVVGVLPSSGYVDHCMPVVDLPGWEECVEHLPIVS